MSDAATTASTDPDPELLHAVCRELAEAADAVGEAARHASELALGGRLTAGALGRGGARRLGWRTLLRTLTDPAGLGWAPRGRGVARAGWLAGVLTGRESLAVSLAVCGLKARIRAAGAGRPELLADPDAAGILTAVEEGRQAEAVRLFREVMRVRGAEHAFALLSPSFADLLAWHALTDENPFNDHAGWQIATGRAMPAEPLLGLGAATRAFFDRGPRRVEAPDRPDGLLDRLDTSGTVAGCVRNLASLGTDGTLLVQQVIGPDGVLRYVIHLAEPPGTPGTCVTPAGAGRPVTDDAHAVADGPQTSHARAVARAVRALVPSGTELALFGRGLGGSTALHLAGSRDFTTVYPVTHVFAVDYRGAARRPVDPRTRVFRLTGAYGQRSRRTAYTAPARFRSRITDSRLVRIHDGEEWSR
ncbi:hypothetical protein ACIRO3_19450 [Streptomyces sp. NPDC102278]|uniref:hypothetical protein n=1 Tax=Streptomyces sp. NPDC102278 TaxID=3366152 RepID=UPI00382F5C92